MSDVLTQEEVDALLEGVSKGVLGGSANRYADEDVTPYDLTATDHIARSDLPSMDLLNQGFSRYLKQSLRKLLKDGVEITVGDVVEEKFSDYVATLPEPTMLYQVNIPSLKSNAMFVISADLLKKYVDIYFGGGSKALEAAPREGFTSTELRIADQILEVSLRHFRAAWEPILSIETNVVKSETSPAFCKFIESVEPTVISKFNVQLGEENLGELSCVLLSSMLAPLYEKMDASNRGSQSEHRAAWTRSLKNRLPDIALTLKSPIARRRFSLGKLVRLQAGDIIPIELDSIVPLEVGSVELFRGKFGISRNKNSVRIGTDQ